MAAEHQAAAGIAIEPVRQLRPIRQAEAQAVQQALEVRPALGAGMHREAGRLVEDQHQRVAIQETRVQLLGAHGGKLGHQTRTPWRTGQLTTVGRAVG